VNKIAEYTEEENKNLNKGREIKFKKIYEISFSLVNLKTGLNNKNAHFFCTIGKQCRTAKISLRSAYYFPERSYRRDIKV